MRKQIKEEDKIHEDWYKEAKGMTLESLPEFLRKLSESYDHDYGTICHAMASAAVATAWAMEKTPQGGITGFQAGCVMWLFITGWMSKYKDKPLRLIDYENMLYPQHGKNFTSISSSTWAWLQEQAQKKLQEVLLFRKFGDREILFRCFDSFRSYHGCGIRKVSPNVFTHWKNIYEGIVPFGYSID